MNQTKIMPRHLLLIFVPVMAAVLGGLLFNGNLKSFMQASSGRGISQAQLYLGISLLCGALAFGHRCLSIVFRWAIALFLPLIFSFQVLPQLGKTTSLSIIFILNLAFALGLWLILKFVFFSRNLIKVRTVVFALLAALLLTLYFRLLFLVLGMPFATAMWSGYYWNSLFLFIFVGFGLSLADIVIIRKEVSENHPTEQPEEAEDDEQDDQ